MVEDGLLDSSYVFGWVGVDIADLQAADAAVVDLRAVAVGPAVWDIGLLHGADQIGHIQGCVERGSAGFEVVSAVEQDVIADVAALLIVKNVVVEVGQMQL